VTPPPPPAPSLARTTAAWAIHLFTASGAVVGAFALLAVSQGELSGAAVLMLMALAIDSVDGSLARKIGVERVVPAIDGRRLDDMIDYLNYVIVPALFMVAAGSLVHWSLMAVPILASAYGFSRSDAKTEDDFFLGFPSYWNVIAIYLWLLDIGPGPATLIVAVFAALVFVPFKFVYPSKLRVLGWTTNVLAAVWMFVMAFIVIEPKTAAKIHLVEISLSYPIYYHVLSWFLGGMRRPRR
jgi:phosphatidylcholine synthase